VLGCAMRKSVLPVVILIVLGTLHEHGDDLTRGDAKYNTRTIDNFLELSGYPGNWTSLPAGTKQGVLETPGALVVGSEAPSLVEPGAAATLVASQDLEVGVPVGARTNRVRAGQSCIRRRPETRDARSRRRASGKTPQLSAFRPPRVARSRRESRHRGHGLSLPWCARRARMRLT